MPPIEDDKLLGAIDDAVKDATPADVREATPDTDVDGAAQTDPEADAAAAAAAADADAEAAAAADKAKGGEQDPPDPKAADPKADRGDGRNAAGEFVKKKDETDADFEKRKTTPDPKAAKAAKPEIDPKTGKPKAAAAAKPTKIDHVNDPIPVEVKGKTRERMEGLVSVAKTLTTERDTLRGQLKDFNDAIAATGANPDTFAKHMEVLEYILSDDPDDQREAVKMLRSVADKLSKNLGDTPPGADPLEGHQDLADKVEDGDITKELAIELAEARNRKKAGETRGAAKTEQQQLAQQHVDAVNQARADLNALGAQLAKTDKLFAAKAKILVPAVQAMAADMPPAKWLATYKKMYDNLPITSVAAPATNGDGKQRVPAGTGARQPQRSQQPAGGGAKAEPKSIEEAISFGIDQAARR